MTTSTYPKDDGDAAEAKAAAWIGVLSVASLMLMAVFLFTGGLLHRGGASAMTADMQDARSSDAIVMSHPSEMAGMFPVSRAHEESLTW